DSFFCFRILSIADHQKGHMRRRELLKTVLLMPAVLGADVPAHLWQGYDFGSGPPVRHPGLGLVGYAWEESGPSLAARAGRETLAQHVDKISSLPFVDVLYIRCDWR